MRRLRRIKISRDPWGPASSDLAMIRRLFEGRRRSVPHQHEPHPRMTRCGELVATIRNVESSYGRPDRYSGRSPGGRSFGLAPSAEGAGPAPERPVLYARFPTRRRATPPRVNSPASGDFGRAAARPCAAARTTARCGLIAEEDHERACGHPVSWSAAGCPTARASACRTRICRSRR